MIKRSIQEEDITIINTYAPNIGAPQYVKRMLTIMKGKISSNTIIVGDINIPLTSMDRSTKQKISKETQTLHDTMDQFSSVQLLSRVRLFATPSTAARQASLSIAISRSSPRLT